MISATRLSPEALITKSRQDQEPRREPGHMRGASQERGDSRIMRSRIFFVMRCCFGFTPNVPARPEVRAGMCPGGCDSPSGHQMVPALKTQLPLEHG